MFEIESEFYKTIYDWIDKNSEHEFYIYSSQQNDNQFYEFCSAVLNSNKIPVLLTNVGSFNARYPLNLRMAMGLSDKVRVYEVAKMAMDIVLDSKANLFIETNGGILWIQ